MSLTQIFDFQTSVSGQTLTCLIKCQDCKTKSVIPLSHPAQRIAAGGNQRGNEMVVYVKLHTKKTQLQQAKFGLL